MTAGPLFRHEALEARTGDGLGEIRIAQPIGHYAAASMAIVVVALIAAFAIFGSYTRRATVPGFLEPEGGTLRVTAPASGAVTSVAVREGQRVAQGTVLFVLSGERLSNSGPTQAAIGDQLETRRAMLAREQRLSAERHEARTRATSERIAALDVELAQLESELAINRAREAIATRNVERFDDLARTGFVSPIQAQARVDDALVLQAQRENLKRVRANLLRERSGLASQLADSRLQAETEQAELARTAVALAQERAENEARRTTIVVASHAATVTGIAAHIGQVVAGGALLATLVPDGARLEANLFASTRQVGFVARGQRVRLRYAAFPYQKFGVGEGLVSSIEESPYAPQELSTQALATLGPGALQGAEPVYRIVVALDAQTIAAYGKPQPLKPGMVFEADVMQDRRHLHEWLFEPIYGLTGR